MNTLSKAMLTSIAGPLLVTAMPAHAHGYPRDRDRIDAGDVIAGALIIGGIAAIASAANKERRWRGGYDDRYATRDAVDQCVRAAQRQANRYGGWARVTDVTRIDRVGDGYVVRGRLVVERRGSWNDRSDVSWDRGPNRAWDRTWDRNQGAGWDRQDRWGYRYDRYDDGYDKGRFACVTRYGRVDDLVLSGLRG